MLKRGPFSFISYELVKESKGVIFSAKIASFFTGFEGRKRVVFYCTFTGFEGRKRVVFTLLLRALRAVKKNLNSSPCSLSRLYLERFLK
jgi:hypothetical protein